MSNSRYFGLSVTEKGVVIYAKETHASLICWGYSGLPSFPRQTTSEVFLPFFAGRKRELILVEGVVREPRETFHVYAILHCEKDESKKWIVTPFDKRQPLPLRGNNVLSFGNQGVYLVGPKINFHVPSIYSQPVAGYEHLTTWDLLNYALKRGPMPPKKESVGEG